MAGLVRERGELGIEETVAREVRVVAWVILGVRVLGILVL